MVTIDSLTCLHKSGILMTGQKIFKKYIYLIKGKDNGGYGRGLAEA